MFSVYCLLFNVIAYSVITICLIYPFAYGIPYVYCLFIYFLFLCCKYRPFFPIFFYIIPTKICKILFFCKKPLFPSLFPLFFSIFLFYLSPPSSLSFPLFVFLFLSLFSFSLLYPAGWVRCSSAASLSLLSCLPYNPLKSNHSPPFGEGLGVRLLGEAS